jgi:AcrR family transcriptional regulator
VAIVRERGAARAAILDAAGRILARDGSADFATRAVAAEAGVNQSLIHYHFGTKENLMLAVLADMDARLLARQDRMYGSDLSFSEKWARATAFYRDDLASGYIRLRMELWVLGLANPAIRRAMLESNARWRRVLVRATADALEHFGIRGVAPEEAATAVIDFWLGMELEHLLGVPEDEGRHWRALETIRGILAGLEARGDGREPS